jgi:hypothetical protein
MNTTEPSPHFNAPLLSLEEMWRFLQQSSMDFDRRMKESKATFDKQMQESKALAEQRATAAEKSRIDFDKRMKELSKQLGGHANRLGEFVQEMVRPAVVRLFQERGLPVHQVSSNMKGFDDNGKIGIEIDLIVVNTETLILVECKSKLTHDGVNEHLVRLAAFKQYFPIYDKYTVLGAVAGIVMPENVSDYAKSQGLFVLAQSGDSIEIRNTDTFEPKEW